MVIAMPDNNSQSNSKPSHNAVTANCSAQIPTNSEESPNIIVYRKMEKLVDLMQDETLGVPVRTVKSFMSKIPSVFTGSDLISWMVKNLDVDDQNEALHLAHLMAAHGYFFPIDDHILTMKNDGTFYRFQTPYFWPSNCWEPENTDYAVYLCKRTMQNKARLELSDFEAENLARLQKMFSRKWEFIFMQAEAQSRVDKKRDKLERKVLDSQERAFWDVHRPVPGCVNTTEIDIKKACSMNKPGQNKSVQVLQAAKAATDASTALVSGSTTANPGTDNTGTADVTDTSPICIAQVQKDPLTILKREIETLKQKIDRRNFKISKVAESYIAYYEQYLDYDPMFTAPELPNPWISESIEAWDLEKLAEVPARRVKRWAFSLKELLHDPAGREHFSKFLDKEFSGENLKFWEAVETLRNLPLSQVPHEVDCIWEEYLCPDAKCPVNIDCRSLEVTKEALNPPSRWSFDVAAAHVYQLMKTDSYQRYLRSEMYKDFLSGSKKKTSVKGIRSIVNFAGRKDTLVP